MNWILLTLAAAGIEAISNVFDRFFLKNDTKQPDSLLGIWGVFALIMFCTPALISQTVSLDSTVILFGLLAGAIYILAMHFYYQAIARAEVTRIVPILSLGPMIIVVGASLFFQEAHTILQFIGIGIILLGMTIEAFDNISHKFIARQAIIFMSLAAILFATKNLLAKGLSLESSNPLNVLFWVGWGVFIFSLPYLFKHRKEVFRARQKLQVNFCLAAALAASCTMLYTSATLIGPAGLVAFLHRIEIFFVFIIAQVIDYRHPKLLKEKFNKKAFWQKLIGVLLIFIGSFFLM
ncbi:EamA family transporter [Candidatus Peregrinibacteria bacterium]|nr:EamA family transporter [Candidatus Peregrinibacteria bacterium]